MSSYLAKKLTNKNQTERRRARVRGVVARERLSRKSWKARENKVDLTLCDYFAVEIWDYIYGSQEKKMLEKEKHSWLW